MRDRRHYRQWKGGKGSADRTTDRTRFRLGMALIKIADQYGKDSKEYRAALKEWREAR